MNGFDVWDGLLLAAAAFVAVTSLARLMSRRRDQITTQFRTEMEQHQQRQRAEKKRKKETDQEEAA